MKTGSVLSAICAALLGAADCAPTSQQSPDLQAREGSSWMDAYSLPNFAGFHKRYEVPHGQCSKNSLCKASPAAHVRCHADRSASQVVIRGDFPPGTAAGLSSVQNGPRGTTECTLFAFADCNVRPGFDNDWGDRLASGGVHQDLDDPEISWGNKAQAIKCFAK
ncbi:hypothetical protein RB594_005616 [Gaeumannomyces avenae]